MKENLHNESIRDDRHSTNPKHSDDKPHPHPKPPKDKEICLIFIVNGKPEKIEAKVNWHLKKAVEIALKESGNEGRPLSDWSVKWNNRVLDMEKKIEEFNFPECAELFLSLNAGQGGNTSMRRYADC
ncbi:MAG: DUF2604 domain-containing protein [Chitinophagaceae bacterium]|nr:DUF2604 domain-containing protein [Chitinophagaceae bacterium]